MASTCSGVAVAAVRPCSASMRSAIKALTTPTSAGPMMEENLPKMSKKPKNSPLRSLSGMSLPNIERDSAWMPPWLVAHSTASVQNCHRLSIKKPNTQMNMYTQMPTPTMRRAPKRAASFMYSRQNGRPSTCTSSSASSMPAESSPRLVP